MYPLVGSRRQRWRLDLRSGQSYLGLVLASGLVATCGPATTLQPGAVDTPPAAVVTSRPSVTASQPISHEFQSDLYGFELVVPAPWQVQRASTAWVSGVLEGRCPSDWDCFSDTAGARTLAIAAIEVPRNTTLRDWQATIHASAPPGVADSDPPRETMLGGQAALAWTAASADEGVNVIKLVALRGTRAYAALFVAPTSLSLAADQAAFDALIGTFRFSVP